MFWFGMLLFTSRFFSIFDILLNAEINNYNRSSRSTGSFLRQTSKYSEEERNALVKFRQLVNDTLDKDYEHTDSFLIPWIRSSDFNLLTARMKLRKAKQWRKDNRMDTILNESVLGYYNNRRYCILDGLDYDGNPVILLNDGGVDIRQLVLRGKVDQMTRAMAKCLEETVVKIRHMANVTGKDITQSVCVIDFNGFNIKQHACLGCIRMYLNFFRNIENYYPELAKHLVVINVPTAAKPLTELAKGIMSKHTAKVLQVFGTDKAEWSSYLLKLIPPDQLPIYYGGTRNIKIY